eukprot:jgi/Undpi1/494/HiC_scaffold_10.g03960.m1
MEQLLEIAGRDMDGQSSGDARVVFGDERDMEELEELEDEDEEDEEVDDDEDEDEEEEDEDDEEEVDRPVKRQRGGADVLSHLQQNTIIAPLGGGLVGGAGGVSSGSGGPGASAGGSRPGSTLSGSAGDNSDDSDEEDNDDDQEKEVIEILSDEEDAHSSNSISHGRTTINTSTPARRSSGGGGGGGSFVPPWMARASSPLGPSSGRGEEGKPSAGGDKIGAQESAWAGQGQVAAGRAVGGAAEVEAEAEGVAATKVSAPLPAAAVSVTSNLKNGNAVGGSGGDGGTVLAAAGSTAVTEVPINFECAICLSPVAVAALFACGHGSCWECAHDWCSRNTSPTMDCPTCHVSIPRGDFRRCIVLDEVVGQAVTAAGQDDDEWRSRLERGQNLAREAEAARRGARDAQRNAEETIAEQAAEIQRLREEARSRAPGRWRRPYDDGGDGGWDGERRWRGGEGWNGAGAGEEVPIFLSV